MNAYEGKKDMAGDKEFEKFWESIEGELPSLLSLQTSEDNATEAVAAAKRFAHAAFNNAKPNFTGAMVGAVDEMRAPYHSCYVGGDTVIQNAVQADTKFIGEELAKFRAAQAEVAAGNEKKPETKVTSFGTQEITAEDLLQFAVEQGGLTIDENLSTDQQNAIKEAWKDMCSALIKQSSAVEENDKKLANAWLDNYKLNLKGAYCSDPFNGTHQLNATTPMLHDLKKFQAALAKYKMGHVEKMDVPEQGVKR